MRRELGLGFVLTLLAFFMTSGVAFAQASRTWVSGTGDDVNPCSRTAPCKTFAGAISKTLAGGEISVLDPAGYGALTITKSISIVALGVEGSVLVSGTNGIVISAGAGDNVSLRGIQFEGLGSGLNGILVNSAASVHIENCAIRGFTQSGILLQSAATHVDVKSSSIYQNAKGITISSGGLTLEDSSLEHNTTANISISGSASALNLANNVITASTAIQVTGSPSISSFGNNSIVGTNPVTNKEMLQ